MVGGDSEDAAVECDAADLGVGDTVVELDLEFVVAVVPLDVVDDVFVSGDVERPVGDGSEASMLVFVLISAAAGVDDRGPVLGRACSGRGVDF